MSKILLILLISFSFAQNTIDGITLTEEEWLFQTGTTTRTEYPYDLWEKMFNKKGLVQVTIYDKDTYFPTLLSYEIYAEECYTDTLKAELFEQDYTSEQQYIVEIDGMNWMISVKQLEDKGYFYQYRWITNTVIDETNPMKFEYIFVKEPTMKGFIEWLK